MDWQTIITSFLAGLGGTAFLIAVAIFLGKKWIGARIEKSIQHEYDRKLEEYKAQLRQQASEAVQQMQGELQDSFEQKTADKELFKKFLSILPSEGSISFLRTHDMGGAFRYSNLEQLSKFYHEWQGPEFEFLDLELKEKCEILHKNADEYIGFLSLKIFPVHGYGDLYSVPRDWLEDRPDDFKKIVDKLHLLSDKLIESHEDFIRTARVKLKI